MKKFVLTICVVIICMVTALFYGKTGIKTTTAVGLRTVAELRW